jgi:predicted AlkP superfamily phosphohydrolase/phosphomutase
MLAALAFASFVAVPDRVVIVSWDGAADWVVDRLLAEGRLPTVARMAREGVAAEHMTQAFPSKTAVGHFAAFSGTWPRQNGVVNNAVPLLPRAEHTILERRSGFDGASHLTEPLWVTAAKAGKTALCLSAAGAYPPAPDQERLRKARVPLSRFIDFSGFEAGIEGPQAVDLEGKPETLRIGRTEVRLVPEKNAAGAFDRVRVEAGDARFEAFPKRVGDLTSWVGPVRIEGETALVGFAYFRLYTLDPQSGKTLLYVRGVNGMNGTQPPSENERYLAAYGGFHDSPWSLYERGGLGPTLWQDGDGTAEARLVENVALDQEFLKRSFREGLKRYRGDIVFHYTPNSDSAGHTWMGALDPQSGIYRADLAAKIWPYYAQVFSLQDAWLADMMRAAGPKTTFVLISDHGMAGVDKRFDANAALEAAGLLVRTREGQIDLARTKICAPPWGDNQLVVNSTEWKSGVVPLAEKAKVVDAAEKVLLDVRDPETGRPIVTRVFRPDEAPEMGIGGPAGGDLYFDVAPSYVPGSGRGVVSKLSSPIGDGVHGFWPLRRDMHAIFYMSGPGVVRGKKLPPVRAVDVVPTVCRLMGLQPSADTVGLVVGQALGSK